ncbi:wax ester/triacylglycerol synthase family O-acyltransferase [Nonomuraea longicatena]|uniref:Diacylglycerol O-acyltransferase n=1 Tax=Nonomuraea longicatena TaxID=83682 RepID=A0ABN1NPR1_9ACTN
MHQLSALDAQFLNAESPTTAAHVAGLAVLDPLGAVLDREALAGLLEARMHLSPALRLRLRTVPFGLDHPYWAPDPDFDLDRHLFARELPAPGGEHELAEAVGEVHARRLDRDRPLWEMHLITGLTGGRIAVYTKVHHAAIDGVSGAELLAAFLDLTPEPRLTPEPQAEDSPAPGLGDMLAGAARSVLTHPARALGSLVRAAGELDSIPLAASLPGARRIARAARLAAGDREPRSDLPDLTVPRTPWNGPISAERRVSFGSVPLKDVKAVAKAHGLSVNDVVMTMCASALRAWLLARGELPPEPLIAGVPVALSPDPESGAGTTVGNRIAAIVAPLATDVAEPYARLHAVGRSMRAAKRRFAESPANWLHELCALLPAPVSALAVPAAFRLASVVAPPINLIISNVPGPQFPLYLCGARVLSYYPLSVLTDATGGVNITCFSYDGMIDFGVVACPERLSEVWTLMAHLRTALEELLDEGVGDELGDGVGIDLVPG